MSDVGDNYDELVGRILLGASAEGNANSRRTSYIFGVVGIPDAGR